MPRNSIHDIKPSIKLRKSKGYESRRLEHEDDEEFEEEEVVLPKRRRRDVYEDSYMSEKKSGGGKAIWYVAVFCILFLVFALSFFFSSASVIVTPRSGNIEINKLVVANKNPLDNKSLSFDLVTLSGEESVSIENTEKKYVERKATGKVRIFNNNSSEVQKLLIDTRLVAGDGKIYKTVKAVVVPGQKTVDGKKIPGSIDVDIYAEASGEEYNKPETDLKIFGFKGNPKYETIYAKSIGEISGGFKGETFALSAEEETTQKLALETKLKESLLEKARAELPEGFIIYDDAVILEKEAPEAVSSDAGTKLLLKGKLHAFIFKKENLIRELVKEAVPDFDKNKVTIKDLESISLSLMSASEIDPTDVDSISVSVKGNTEIIWEIDEQAIKDVLVGVKERKFESIIGEFKSIEKAELQIKPIWKTTVPSEIDRINVVNTISEE
ncbi:MAG: hypothetical protein QG654_219 [Patescibacteria group bacterium]|nr:hypothetical protein [Patescibacteria group bacterium]